MRGRAALFLLAPALWADDRGEFRRELSAREWNVGLGGALDRKSEPKTVEIKPDRENVVELVVR